VISNQNDQYRPQDIEWTLTQDITSLNSTWALYYYNCWDEHYFRLAQVQHRRVVPPYLSAWWDYKPSPDWSLHFELDDLGSFVYDDRLYDYAGPRDTFPLNQIEELSIKSQPRLYIKIRRTF
jgi:hypothetical protein